MTSAFRTAASSARRTPALIACAARSDWPPSSSRWTWTKTRCPTVRVLQVVEAPHPRVGRDDPPDLGDELRVRRPVHQRVPGRDPDAPGADHQQQRRSPSATAGSSQATPNRDEASERQPSPRAPAAGPTDSAAGRPRRSSSRCAAPPGPARATSPAVTATETAITTSPAPLRRQRLRRRRAGRSRVQPISAAEAVTKQRLPERHQVLGRAVPERMVLVRRPRRVEDPGKPGERGDQVERRIGQRGRDRQRAGRRQRPELERDQQQRDADRGEAGREVQAMRSSMRAPEPALNHASAPRRASRPGCATALRQRSRGFPPDCDASHRQDATKADPKTLPLRAIDWQRRSRLHTCDGSTRRMRLFHAPFEENF